MQTTAERYGGHRPLRTRATAFGLTALLHIGVALLLVVRWHTSTPPPSAASRLVVELTAQQTEPESESSPPEEQVRPPQRPQKQQVLPKPIVAPIQLTLPAEAPAAPSAAQDTEPSPPTPRAETAPAPRPKPPPPGASSSGPDSWEGQVMARLERVKRYPSAARVNRVQGVVHVRFRVSRAGAVLFTALQRSSGNDLLDRAALETVRRAAPLPKIPDNRPDELEVTVPIEFYLR